jgi:hypothetical protein
MNKIDIINVSKFVWHFRIENYFSVSCTNNKCRATLNKTKGSFYKSPIPLIKDSKEVWTTPTSMLIISLTMGHFKCLWDTYQDTHWISSIPAMLHFVSLWDMSRRCKSFFLFLIQMIYRVLFIFLCLVSSWYLWA